MVGWDVYKELFDEMILESSDPSFFILPVYGVFEILHEFVYHQFQGFFQLRTSNFNSALKPGLVDVDGKLTSVSAAEQQAQQRLREPANVPKQQGRRVG
jgi:RNA polymerase I-associated factor PAF67